MKNSIALVALCLFITTNSWAYDPKIPKLEEEKPFEFVLPEIQIFDYPSGARLYFLANKELPVIEMDVMVRLGTIHEPADKKGLLSLLMNGLRTGGAGNLSGDELDLKIENLAMTLSTNPGAEVSFISAKSLKEDKKNLFDVFFDVLKKPSFESAKIELARQQILQILSRRNENPMQVAKREFLQRLYGDQNVWARTSEESTIKNISREDLIEWHRKYFAPNRFWFVVTGDISFDEAKKMVGEKLAGWPNTDVALPAIAPIKKEWEAKTYLIDQDVKQSAVVLGHFGEKRFNPDKFALIVGNYMLGGSTFGSRLGNWIRTSLGLAYGISSNFGLSTDFGAFQVVASTQTNTTVHMIEEIKKTISQILNTSPFMVEELENAKKAILSQLVFENDEPAKIVRARRYYDFYGYPPDYLSVYQKEIEKVTLVQVAHAFKKYFHPDKLIVLIVGNKKGMESLPGLGPIIEQPLDNN